MSIQPVGNQTIVFDPGAQNEQDQTVFEVQHAMNQLGGSLPLEENGVFDRATEQAVRRFQDSQGIHSPEGTIDQPTIEALNRQVQLRNAPPPTPPSPAATASGAGDALGERRLEGDIRRAQLQNAIPVSQAGSPLSPPPATALPHDTYDFRNVHGGGIFERGVDDALQNQHAQNLQVANTYANQYGHYVDRYLQQMNNAGSFADLQRLGPIRPPEQFGVGVHGQAETGRQQSEMDALRRQIQEVNSRTGDAQQRADMAVADRIRQLRGDEPFGPNLNLEISADDLIPGVNLSQTTNIDADGLDVEAPNVEAHGGVSAGRFMRVQGGVDSNGEVTGEVSAGIPDALRVTAQHTRDGEGEVQTTVGVEAGDITVEAGSDSHVRIEADIDGITAGAEANPREGTFSQSVSVGIPGTDNASLQISLGFRGVSAEDTTRVSRALAGAPGFFELPMEVIRSMDRRYGH